MFWFWSAHYCLGSDIPIYIKSIFKDFLVFFFFGLLAPFFYNLFLRKLWSSLNDLKKEREISMKLKTYTFHSNFLPDKFTVFWILPLCLTLVEKLKIFLEHNSLFPLVTFELYTTSFAFLTNTYSKGCTVLNGWSKSTFSYLGKFGFIDDMEFGVYLWHSWKHFALGQ